VPYDNQWVGVEDLTPMFTGALNIAVKSHFNNKSLEKVLLSFQ